MKTKLLANARMQIRDFSRDLGRKIAQEREWFFDKADNHYERRQNQEVRDLEKRKDPRFNYKNLIEVLSANLALTDKKSIEKSAYVILNGLDFRITGVYVEFPHRNSHNREALLLDVAHHPKNYVNN